jgi:2-keto-4-pentenoate hydratase
MRWQRMASRCGLSYSFAMTAHVKDVDVEAIAREVIVALASRSQIATFSSRPGGLTLEQAYRVPPLLRSALEARGERITGRKIGFTNREMWKVYGVDSPVWGYATSRTTHTLSDTPVVPIAELCEPRIEPEIMFGLGAPPAPDMGDSELIDCVEWVALGYEIVQSIFPGWKFTGADTVAANGVHGLLLVGRRHPIAPRNAEWLRELAAFEVELCRNGEVVQRGGGALVLESPLLALQHLVKVLAKDPNNPPLVAGDIISTGTLTLPMPVNAGESWTTRVTGIPLEDSAVRFA